MDRSTEREAPFNRRRFPRVKLAVPVQIGRRGQAAAGGVSKQAVASIEVSPGGLYVTTEEGERFVLGEIVAVSLIIPWQLRNLFPFSRIVGSCRVVRVDTAATPNAAGKQAVALAFCEQHTTCLGSNMSPR
ncbi:MAG: hypothetical protein COV75_04340 [Candidatus Omnitrophica bacterium CG11_big_fil_rev_8_21_14_0_20_63_9]|nr:MAG: hypothetical protein COV75_04340 [Candidatus Omnitrophica bacterium CG11_big_fil_rev_8_21_14_0_20_63_9]